MKLLKKLIWAKRNNGDEAHEQMHRSNIKSEKFKLIRGKNGFVKKTLQSEKNSVK